MDGSPLHAGHYIILAYLHTVVEVELLLTERGRSHTCL